MNKGRLCLYDEVEGIKQRKSGKSQTNLESSLPALNLLVEHDIFIMLSRKVRRSGFLRMRKAYMLVSVIIIISLVLSMILPFMQ